MPRNITGGNKSKKRKNSTIIARARKEEDIAKDEKNGEVYGIVEKATGSRRFNVICQHLGRPDVEYQTVNCKLRGSCKKNVKAGCCVLVLFELGMGIIDDVYSTAEVIRLDIKGLWDFRHKPTTDRSDEITDSDDGIEFIDESADRARTLEKSAADDRAGPALIAAVAAVSTGAAAAATAAAVRPARDDWDDEVDIDAI